MYRTIAELAGLGYSQLGKTKTSGNESLNSTMFSRAFPRKTTKIGKLQRNIPLATFRFCSDMSVRVVARIRPLLKSENEKDSIVEAAGSDAEGSARSSTIKIPNPKKVSESFTFQFNSVYDHQSTQQELFDAEVNPTVKHLFLGYDVTIFAYGSTGTGKTHTMRGGKSLADRGMIPRMLSSVYRRSRKIEKDSGGERTVKISMSYYEIYNDRVFDLFEAPEKRTATGLPLREAGGGKTVVVGLSEMPCGSLKEFEVLYDKANANRSTSATKLNAHSSRSHAVLCVKLTITTPTEVRTSIASAIDLAGSEDNRRTGNDKERMVESASINKSLFVLAQCVEAISKKQQRIPYRESKMTRILSLGQNNGFTIMILNLAPINSYHLDTLSSLNFANRTKKIEVREVENEPLFRGPARPPLAATGPNLQRQPLRPLTSGVNINVGARQAESKAGDKPPKSFSVYSDRGRPRPSHPPVQRSSPPKRGPEPLASSRPSKMTARPTPTSFLRRGPAPESSLCKATIEQLVEEKVSSILAARGSQQVQPPVNDVQAPPKHQASTGTSISEEVQRRLVYIEERLEGQEGARAEGLSFLLMAKQHQARGEENSALKMYQLAKPYFPGNVKLEAKIEALKGRIGGRRAGVQKEKLDDETCSEQTEQESGQGGADRGDMDDESYHDDDTANPHERFSDDPGSEHTRRRPRKRPKSQKRTLASSPDPLQSPSGRPTAPAPPTTPRTNYLLSVINTADVQHIKALRGVGPKRAEGIVESLAEMEGAPVMDLKQLSRLRGVGSRTVQGMRAGIMIS